MKKYDVVDDSVHLNNLTNDASYICCWNALNGNSNYDEYDAGANPNEVWSVDLIDGIVYTYCLDYTP